MPEASPMAEPSLLPRECTFVPAGVQLVRKPQFLCQYPSRPSSHNCMKAGEADWYLLPQEPKEQAWRADKISWEILSPREKPVSFILTKQLKAVCILCESGPEQRNIQMMIMGVFKICLFLPGPGQYLQSRHANKKPFFSGFDGLVSQVLPMLASLPSTKVSVERAPLPAPWARLLCVGYGVVGKSRAALLFLE